MEFNIRQATVDDITSIVSLSLEHLENQQVQIDEGTVQVTFQVLLEHPAYQVFVANRSDQGLVGLITAGTCPLNDGEHNLVFLENLFVLESARSHGIAHQLIDAVMMQSTTEKPIYATSVNSSDVADTGTLFVNAGYRQADDHTTARLVESLKALPLERGLEGDLTYYTLTAQ